MLFAHCLSSILYGRSRHTDKIELTVCGQVTAFGGHYVTAEVTDPVTRRHFRDV